MFTLHKTPVKGVFFDGQVWDAYALISQLIKGARKRVILTARAQIQPVAYTRHIENNLSDTGSGYFVHGTIYSNNKRL